MYRDKGGGVRGGTTHPKAHGPYSPQDFFRSRNTEPQSIIVVSSTRTSTGSSSSSSSQSSSSSERSTTTVAGRDRRPTEGGPTECMLGLRAAIDAQLHNNIAVAAAAAGWALHVRCM